MSIKKLFESVDSSRNYLSNTDLKEAFKDVESSENVSAISTKQQTFVPQIDYSNPVNFAKFGSAQVYYKSAMDRIADYYPYDGSEYEVTEFYNKSLDIEKYVFNNLYPRTNGFARFSANGWGSQDEIKSGYGLPDNQEYIEFTGGPHTIGIVGEWSSSLGVTTSGSSVSTLFPDDETSKRAYSNIYDDDLYTNAGLESDYGTGSRESNLECNFDKGVTIEFWLKKSAWGEGIQTHKEVIFDIWNGEATGEHDYGRLTLALSGANGPAGSVGSPSSAFIITIVSGSNNFKEKHIGSSQVTKGTVGDGSWKHYALTMQNSGSKFLTKLYITGALDSTTINVANIGTLPSKTSAGAMGGRIGALKTSAYGFGQTSAGAGKLSASLDEFRFWKVARTSDEIGKYWFTHVRGGTNTDISNTTLGLYYKFNEGITGTASVDNSVLDYSGRISNGNWVGYDSTVNTSPASTYGTYGRATGSAIIESTASAAEFKDPIVKSSHPDIVTLRDSLLEAGAAHDYSNNSSFKSLIPSWVVEAQETSDGSDFVYPYDNNIEMVSHVIGAYFDKLRLQIKALPSFKHLNYTSASHTPISFAQHLPQSLGLYMPEIFIDSTVLERFMNRTPTMLFEGDLTETKNLIYLNFYNNLTNIFKSKGTEKAIRNVYRCFHMDDKLVRLNVYSNNETYELKDNLKHTLINKKMLNFNTASCVGGVVYQALTNTGNSFATATIVGTGDLDDETDTSFILTNADGSTVTFTTDSTLNFGDVTADIGDAEATATFVGTADLAGEDGTNLILTNTDGSTVTFTTDPTLNFGDVSADIGDTAAKATIVGTAALAAESGTDFKLVNADGTVITFTTNATKNFGDTVDETASPFTLNTGGDFSSAGIRKATQALWISCKAAIDNGVLDCTISPTTVDPIASGQEYFTLTQTTGGTGGNTAITLITGVTADGETTFTGGFDGQRWRVNTGGDFSSAGIRKATQAFHIACLAAIAAGELDMTAVPATDTGTQTSFTLTQTTGGTAGNTAITLITGMTANGETTFTGGFDGQRWRVNTRDIGGAPAARMATQALYIACKGAIDAAELDMTISPTTVAPVAAGQEYFTLTQTTAGTAGNTAITLITGVTADGETTFTGGAGESRGYISGSQGVGLKDADGIVRGLEFPYGFTVETDIILPRYSENDTTFNRDFKEVSLFGMQSASTDGGADMGVDPTWYANDPVSFQVYAIRQNKSSKNIYFKLTSSLTPNSTTDNTPFPIMTSSYFYDAYDDTRWNISVRLKPRNFGVTDMVSGAVNAQGYDYVLEFKGLNTVGGVVQNSFTTSSTITKAVGHNFLKAAKRLYVGARRTNITGALVAPCDVLFGSAKYWAKYIDDSTLQQHAVDLDNAGVSGSWKDVSPLDLNLKNSGSVFNSHMLALDWRFNNVSSSGVAGGFSVVDFSSGSTILRDRNGWVGELAGYQHTGTGSQFPASFQNVIVSQSINAYQFINPEYAISSDMINIKTNDDKYFGIFETPPDYRYTLEKSMYNAISEEMLDFFAGVVDFNNLIGEPVNRYRGKYKRLEKLREIFFRRITAGSGSSSDGVAHVEKFLDYYKWFDDAVAEVIGQILPASADFNPDAYNTIESHVLERNKYRTKYPTISGRDVDPEGSSFGSFSYFPSPAASSPRPTNKSGDFWKYQADRRSAEITSGDSTIDLQRNNIRDIVSSEPTLPSTAPTLVTVDGTEYTMPTPTRKNSFAKIYGKVGSRRASTPNTIHGGVNFEEGKNIHFTYNALYPAGPVNHENSVFVPRNVLYADVDDIIPLDEITANVSASLPNRKLKRIFSKVHHGRDWQNGGGYSNVRSTISFPFNIMSSSVSTGYNSAVVRAVSASLEIVNLHNDAYGADMEIPMQGPFTEHHVGGHQSRHVSLNTGSTLDTHLTRHEAWKLLLGRCPELSGALGMVGADYPWPEANAAGLTPYPMTASQKAVYYRDFIAKRPVNIKNIRQATSSVLGNYSHNFEIVSTVGAFSNPRRFIDQQTTLPTAVLNIHNGTVSGSTNVIGFFSTLHRDDDSHFDFGLTYAPVQFTGSNNKSIIVGRFGAPGGAETMGRGFQDNRGAEFSPYNAHTYRNLTVLKPFQASGSTSEATGSGIPGIRASDHLEKDYGLRILLSRPSAKFGRDIRFETAPPGKTYTQSPSYQKAHRNNITIINSGTSGYSTGSQYNNAFVTHPIPRAVRQYSWISASLITANSMKYNRHQPTARETPSWLLGFHSTSNGYISYFNNDFVSGTDIETSLGIYQPTVRLNIFTIDPVTASATNYIGFPTASANSSYFNSTFLDTLTAADQDLITGSSANYFNLLMTRRGNTYGWNWKKAHQRHNPVNIKEISGANISLTKVPTKPDLTSYRLTPVTMKGRPKLLNITAPTSSEESRTNVTNNSFTLKVTDNNKKLGTGNTDLDNFLQLPFNRVTTPYDKVLSVAKESEYMINWILHTEGVYPSDYNEFYKTTHTRTSYDNKFWRDSRSERNTVGGTFENSFGIKEAISQSCWPLDAQTDFATRTGFTIPSPGWYTSSQHDVGLLFSGSAGELQNNYFFYFDTSGSTAGPLVNRYEALKPGALYSRKHMLTTPKSVSQWKNIEEAAGQWIKGPFNTASMTLTPEPYGGEAKWEADTLAGILTNSAGAPPASASFISHPSKPWWNEYNDFKYDIKLLAKEYSIVPEFRISEHVEDYVNNGIINSNISGTFEIPGTALDSTGSTFYKDYSNSEFMKDFRYISTDTGMPAKEIRLVMSAAIRFNPYKGFYPAQRTLELVSQFSKSFAAGIIANSDTNMRTGHDLFQISGSLMRPLAQALWAPGILYNTVKSGMAVDYPIVIDSAKLGRAPWTGSTPHPDTNNWALYATKSNTSVVDVDGYNGGAWFDQRLPFETIIEPDTYIRGIPFVDCEPHPSVSLNATASWDGDADSIYTMMASNFFGEVPNFFLANQELTTLKSGIITDDLKFEKNDIFAARITLQRSMFGTKKYTLESGSAGSNADFGPAGAVARSGSAGGSNGRQMRAHFPLPQNPVRDPNFYPLFTMYSRPTAFGPPISGRPLWGALAVAGEPSASLFTEQGGNRGVHDSFSGFNGAYTPPYFDGQAWFDVVFEPASGETYNLERILTEISGIYRRMDPGPPRYNDNIAYYPLIPKCATGSQDPGPIYGGANINANCMQLSASFNLFGIERVSKQTTDKFGNLIENKNETAGKRWVIQSKFETPMVNFSNVGIRPIKSGDFTLTIPTYASMSVPRGMWHQFGTIPPSPDTGIFLSIGDINTNWMKYHYDVINIDSLYNRNNAGLYGKNMFKEMKSLTKLLGFNKDKTKKRMGELASKQTIKEAVVAVPYVIDRVLRADISSVSGSLSAERKKFIEIPKVRFEAATKEMKGTADGDSLDTAGESIRKLLQKMERYVLPPQFDFINNTEIKPIVMYMFEFKYELDQDDLSYIWQNLAPREYQKLSLKSTSVAHELMDTELLNGDVLQNENLRWMVFKVKQRGQTNYYDKIATQVGESSDIADTASEKTKEYPIGFNWPYDYISIVEMAKMDVQVLYRANTGKTSYISSTAAGDHAHTFSVDDNGDGRTSYDDEHYHNIIDGIVQESDGHTHSLENEQ